MLQIAALRKLADEAEIKSTPCPSWLQQRNGCTHFAPFSVVGTHSQEAGNAVAPASLEFVSDDNVSLNKEYDPAVSEATGGGQESMTQVQNAPQSEQLMRHMRREGTSRSDGTSGQTSSSSMSERMPRIFPRFTGRTVLNRPIRVQFSRAPKSGKRALDCIRKCIVEGGLHPVQCHSIC